MARSKKVKISDIAQAAGVSSSTVSYVLSGQRPISDETKRRVLELIDQMGYRPDATARSFAMRKTGVIGLYLKKEISKADLFMQESIRGIVSTISKKGYKLLLLNEMEDNMADDYTIPVDRTFAIDGAIVSGTKNSRHYLSELQKVKMPFVLMGKPPKQIEKNIHYVDNDNYQAAYQAVELLFNRGSKSIALICDSTEGTYLLDYLAGYTAAYGDYQMDFNSNNIIRVEKDPCLDGLKKKLEELRIDGILLLSANTQILNYCVHRTEDLQRAIPTVCFSFDLYKEFYSDRKMKDFYYINSNALDLGSESAQMLLKILEDKNNIESKKLLEQKIIKW